MAVPALSRVEPAMTSGTDGRSDGQIDERLQLGSRIARHEDDLRARLAGARQAATDIRRHAAGRHADDDVLLGRLQPLDRARAVLVAVLGAFLRVEERGLAAGHHRLNRVRVGPERRRHLRRLDDAQPSAGAGADEDHAPALAQRFDDDVDADGDARLLALNRREHFAIVVQHQLDDVGRRRLVDAERRGIDGFGGELLIFRTMGHRV